MYVNRLIEFSETHNDKLPPLGFKNKKIDWIIDIEEDRLTFSPIKKVEHIVPEAARSSNTKPFLIVDKPDYVFGFYDDDKHEDRSRERHESYKKLLDEYIEATCDVDVKLLRKHLEAPIEKPEGMRLGHFIMFRIRDEDLLHEVESVKSFWGEYVRPEESDKTTVLPCMFCHIPSPVIDRHTIDFLIGPDRTKMISANKNAYESHGLKNSHSAPTCYVCEQKYGKALEYLLQRNKNKKKPGGPHMFRIGEITYVYWLRDKNQLDNVLSVFASPTEEQTEDDMRELLRQAFRGKSINRETNNFCLLTLSANKGRLVVRDYVEDTIGNIKKRIEIFFQAQRVGNNRYYGIYTLAATMYIEPRNQMQKYALEEWMGWFLYGRPLSGRVLIPILKRIQAMGVMYPQYASAIKSWLVSQKEGVEWTVNIDKENERTAYITGRVFAVLEKIQQDSIASDNTIASKFFGSASTTPRSVMGLLVRNAQNHLAKLSNAKDTKGLAIYLNKRLGKVMAMLRNFPATLTLEEQGEFALGYYHERQDLFTSKEKKGE